MTDTTTLAEPAPTMNSDAISNATLHWVPRATWPVALCGAIVRGNPESHVSTVGRDRCPKCLRLNARVRPSS